MFALTVLDRPSAGKSGELKETTQKPCFVVGIGASAGAQNALEQIFTALPSDCGLAFVVIMHLPSVGPSFLAEMLGRYTPMKVLPAEEGMALHPDTVHVIPAGRQLTLNDGLFRLEEPADKYGAFHPIDCFFHSLASEVGKHSIAVVLSGFGTDGAESVKAVREAGGIVIVQEPGTALSPSMPRSAVTSGMADFILPAEEIAAKITDIARGDCPLPPRACLATTLDEDLAAIFAIVRARTGHDFSSYKRNTVIRRIERRMAVNDVAGMKKYIVLLETSAQEAQALGQEILIGVTSFFRDPEAFETLRREIIPRLFEGRDPDDPVRIWHACCATGEEVYSTAILIREYLNEQQLDARVQLFATDIDEAAIAQARAGLYSDEIEEDVSEERLRAFFTRVDGRWQVAKQLREMVVFAHHSLLKDPPFSRLDLLVCRNFLIYLNPDMQKRLFSLFHMSLKPKGFLFLGASETVGRDNSLFASRDQRWKIFERLEGSRREDMIFPFNASVSRFPKSTLPPRKVPDKSTGPVQIAEKLLIERYAPPCVVVNENYEVVHVSTRANRFLEVPVGEWTRDFLKMTRTELRPSLRAAIYKSFTEQKQVSFRGVKVTLDGEEAAVNVLVEPLKDPSSDEKLAMVILEQTLPQAPAPGPAAGEEATAGDDASREMLIRQLEEQLRITHEQLLTVTEQLETSQEGFMSANEELMSINEEFQSGNEELQATNEELETSKEELQALNEELVTVNAELQGKVEELDRVNSDMENLFRSSEIATIFLDPQLVIRRFSPAMAHIFNLIAADIGRPFRHMAGTLDWAGLPEDARTVQASSSPVEREVATLDGQRHYLMRVLPYRNIEGRIDGIVVTLVDITGHKRAEEALRESELFYRQILESIPAMVFTMKPAGDCDYLSRQWVDFTGEEMSEHLADACCKLLHPDDRERASLAWRDAAEKGTPYDLEYRIRRHDGKYEWFMVRNRPIRNEAGEIVRWFGTALNIDKLVQTQEELRRAKSAAEAATRAKAQFLANMSHELRTPMTGVMGMLDLTLQGALSDEQRGYLEKVRTSAHALLRILNDILEFSRFEASMIAFVEEPFLLHDSVRGAVELFDLEARLKGLKLELEIAPGTPELMKGDEGRVRQILVNLIGNAVKFTDHGEVKIRVEAGEAADGGLREIIFIVSDTGIGISEDNRSTIFQPFSQGDASHTRRFGGTGLGLAISKEVAERMGGPSPSAANQGWGAPSASPCLSGKPRWLRPRHRRRRSIPFRLLLLRIRPGRDCWSLRTMHASGNSWGLCSGMEASISTAPLMARRPWRCGRGGDSTA